MNNFEETQVNYIIRFTLFFMSSCRKEEKLYVKNGIINCIYYLNLGNEKNNSEKNENVELIFKINPELIKIYTDAIRLRQVIVNLTDNALKFTKQGSVEISYKIKIDSENRIIIFRIKDTGIGMTDEQKEKIFSRFFKIENETDEIYRGAGLGLSISKNIVKLLGGKIWVKSELGKGSSFYFSIPV